LPKFTIAEKKRQNLKICDKGKLKGNVYILANITKIYNTADFDFRQIKSSFCCNLFIYAQFVPVFIIMEFCTQFYENLSKSLICENSEETMFKFESENQWDGAHFSVTLATGKFSFVYFVHYYIFIIIN